MAQYGRILFYDTRDGEVFFDTGEFNGDVMAPNPEVYYKMLEEKYNSRSNISHIQLEYGDYREEFNKHNFCRVIKEGLIFNSKDTKYNLGAKSTKNDRWWPLFEDLYSLYNEEDNTFDAEKICKFYNDYINFNLKQVCEIANPVWMPLSEINRFDNLSMPNWKWKDGIFPSKEEFSNNIYHNGFMFPLHISRKDKTYKIFDGNHRIEACKYLVENNIWPANKKILCLDMKAIDVRHINSNQINYDIGRTIKMHIPTKLIPKYSFIKFLSVKDFDDDISEVEVRRYLDIMILARLYVNEMTRVLCKYKEITGITLTDLVVNSKKAFDLWLTKENDIKLINILKDFQDITDFRNRYSEDTTVCAGSVRGIPVSVLKAFENENVKNILPIIFLKGIEYDGATDKDYYDQWMMINNRVKELYGKSKTLHEPVIYTNVELWRLLNVKYFNTLSSLYKDINICLTCRAYFTIVQYHMAFLFNKKLILGEKVSKNKKKFSHDLLSERLDIHNKELALEFGIEVIDLINWQTKLSDIKDIIGPNWYWIENESSCLFERSWDNLAKNVSKSTISDLSINNFIRPTSKTLLREINNNWQLEKETIDMIIKNIILEDGNE